MRQAVNVLTATGRGSRTWMSELLPQVAVEGGRGQNNLSRGCANDARRVDGDHLNVGHERTARNAWNREENECQRFSKKIIQSGSLKTRGLRRTLFWTFTKKEMLFISRLITPFERCHAEPVWPVFVRDDVQVVVPPSSQASNRLRAGQTSATHQLMCCWTIS